MNRFTVDQVSGQLDELVFRCDAKFYRMEFIMDQDCELTESWGQRLVQLNGAAGTKMRLIEG
ncbi:hypothetical protein DFR28_102461 [Arenicella xantha]|uniref:Uncharacterized protein n=1 Tax=Arenicella xantha TaxID=644221 RepID=A0A395JJZ1_9GAMM|nr:hypothetical protein DFR28_102461 [Arenicella xantha]